MFNALSLTFSLIVFVDFFISKSKLLQASIISDAPRLTLSILLKESRIVIGTYLSLTSEPSCTEIVSCTLLNLFRKPSSKPHT